ncbi:MAG: hypothetical protein E7568_07310 [Ruminococcaceae bacterium]|nr:hypothetical protein [Oscillospiraceae bacterium]
MKSLKSIIAIMLCFIMVLSFTACHKQNEVAVTINGIEFTSAMYSYALINADSEARTIVEEQLNAAATEENPVPDVIDYYSQKIEDKTFEQWVQDEAIKSLANWAAYSTLCKENNITLDEETLNEVKSYSAYYYSYYSALFEANGIGESTYTKMMEYDYLADKYFTFLYGKEGSKAVAENDIKDYYAKNYRVAFILEKSLAELSDADKTNAKAELEDYQKQLNGGESIVEVYNKFYNLSEETAATTGYSPAKEVKECVTYISDPDVDTNYGAEFFEDVKDLAAGKSKIVETGTDDAKTLYLVLIVDPYGDTSYLEGLGGTIRWNLKSEEFMKDIETYAATLPVKKNNYAIKGFKVKDIDYGQ